MQGNPRNPRNRVLWDSIWALTEGNLLPVERGSTLLDSLSRFPRTLHSVNDALRLIGFSNDILSNIRRNFDYISARYSLSSDERQSWERFFGIDNEISSNFLPSQLIGPGEQVPRVCIGLKRPNDSTDEVIVIDEEDDFIDAERFSKRSKSSSSFSARISTIESSSYSKEADSISSRHEVQDIQEDTTIVRSERDGDVSERQISWSQSSISRRNTSSQLSHTIVFEDEDEILPLRERLASSFLATNRAPPIVPTALPSEGGPIQPSQTNTVIGRSETTVRRSTQGFAASIDKVVPQPLPEEGATDTVECIFCTQNGLYTYDDLPIIRFLAQSRISKRLRFPLHSARTTSSPDFVYQRELCPSEVICPHVNDSPYHVCGLSRHQWEIVLIMDQREVRTTSDRYYIAQKLRAARIPVDVRQLPLGDFLWVLRRKGVVLSKVPKISHDFVSFVEDESGKPLQWVPLSTVEQLYKLHKDDLASQVVTSMETMSISTTVIEGASKKQVSSKAKRIVQSVRDVIPATFVQGVQTVADDLSAYPNASRRRKKMVNPHFEAFLEEMKSMFSPQEWMVEHIVERKAVSDLASSIKDGRYNEQKARLRASNMRVTYLVEGNPDQALPKWSQGGGHTISSLTIHSAMFSTSILSGFHVVNTVDLSDSISFLVAMHEAIEAYFFNTSCAALCEYQCSAQSQRTVQFQASSLPSAIPSRLLRGKESVAQPTVGLPPLAAHFSLARLDQERLEVQYCTGRKPHKHTGSATSDTDFRDNNSDIDIALSQLSQSASLGNVGTTHGARWFDSAPSKSQFVPASECYLERCLLFRRKGLVQPLVTYPAWSELASRPRTFTVMQLWGRMLRQVQGVSDVRAQAIIERFPTPLALYRYLRSFPVPEASGPVALAEIRTFVHGGKLGPVLGRRLFETFYQLPTRPISQSTASVSKSGDQDDGVDSGEFTFSGDLVIAGRKTTTNRKD